ncbi:MAG: 2-hydroxyacyl-CoA dehydratase subunit D, partial [Promethearchaeota archaeon]
MCSYTPLELIYAAGFQPYRIEGHAREVNNSDSYTHANMCQVVRSTIDIAAEGGYDFLDGIIFVNSCDAMRRLHDVWKNFFPSKFIHLIDLPKGDIDPIRQAYLREEFQRLKKALEKQASKKIQYDDIKKAVDTYKESRKLFHQMNSLRLSAPPSISGCEIMQLISEFYSSDPILWNERVRTLIYEKNHVNSNEKINKNGKPRVLLSGSP